MNYFERKPLQKRVTKLDQDLIKRFDDLVGKEYGIKTLQDVNNIYLTEGDIDLILYYHEEFIRLKKFDIVDSKKYINAKSKFSNSIRIISIYADTVEVEQSFPLYNASNLRQLIIEVITNQYYPENIKSTKNELQGIGEVLASKITEYTESSINYQKKSLQNSQRKHINLMLEAYEKNPYDDPYKADNPRIDEDK